MTEDNYKFIEEKIIPKKKRLIKETFKKMLKLLFAGAVFGAAAVITGIPLYNALGGVKPTQNPTHTVPTSEPAATTTPFAENDEDSKNEKNPAVLDLGEVSIREYAAVRSMVAELAKQYEDTVVTVTKVTEGVDCFQNPVENSDSFSGLVIRVDNEYLYILTAYDGLKVNSAYEIYFRNGESSKANVHGVDRETGFAVISVRLEDVSVEVLESARKAVIGDSNELNEGDFVMAIGKPVGNMYSMTYGVVLTKPITKYLVDRQVSLFHTDMTCTDDGDGFVMDYQGNVVGIITNRFKNEPNNMLSFIGVSELEELLDILIYNKRMPYMGITASNMSQEYMTENGLENGIYITNVKPGSPAEEASLIAGDIILSVAGEPIKDVLAFTEILATRNIGEEIEVEIFRPYAKKEEIRTVKIVLTESMR